MKSKYTIFAGRIGDGDGRPIGAETIFNMLQEYERRLSVLDKRIVKASESGAKEKPPLELCPEKIYIENQNKARMDDILEAIGRNTCGVVPDEWVRELRMRIDASNLVGSIKKASE